MLVFTIKSKFIISFTNNLNFLLSIPGKTFKKALEWCEQHRNVVETEKTEEEIEEDKRNLNNLTKWELDFISIPIKEMFPLLITSNFLEIKGLTRLMVKAIARQLTNKSEEQIRKDFEVEDPKWTPEELKQLEQENAWADA